LREEVRRRRGERRLTFGVVFPWSSHHLQLREWLRSLRVDPDQDVRIVVVPPAQMFRNLIAGTLDGYCAGEPWNSLAAHAGDGWIAALSAMRDRGHVEKVLLVRADFAGERAREHLALIAALHEAAAWCDEPQNRANLVHLLSLRENLNVTAEVIAPALTGPWPAGSGVRAESSECFIFHRGDANAPLPAAGATVMRQLISAGLLPGVSPEDTALSRRLFRHDLFQQALVRVQSHDLSQT
jgi:ABC-type nitrate/sulfonate/bicarbonate transport system substrate-binding protein